MPASVCDSVSNALHLSIAEESENSSLLDSRIYSSVKSVLLSNIEFEESGDYQSNVLDGLKSKYVVIRPNKQQVLESKIHKKEGVCNGNQSENGKNSEEVLPKPKRVFFSIENVQLGYQGSWSAGVGMQNVGNTCYLNSTLQALFHVPAFVNWLVSEASHAEKCNQQEACVICGMYATLMATQKSAGGPIKPWQVYSKLRLICRQLTPGRQEDAHEFLRHLIEAMEKSYLSRFINAEKLDQYSKETTPLNQILGGYLRSTVRCLTCHHLSTTFQHVQDLLLDIRKHTTLDEALDSFFTKEKLEDLGYKCEACNKKVCATKQFFVEKAPMVLCLALKRFSLAGGKLSKHLQFRKKINLGKYMYNKSNQQKVCYRLVSLVTHFGPSQSSGHYTAIGQSPNGNYYQFDDTSVWPLPLSAVLGTNSYFMFYERDYSLDDVNTGTTGSSMGTVYGPQLPENLLNREKSPLKLTFHKNDERKSIQSSGDGDAMKSEKKPLLLNSILEKPSSASEPWVVKQNGEVEKISKEPKILNGLDKINGKLEDNKKFILVNRSQNVDGPKPKLPKSELFEKIATFNGVAKQSKSPLQKLEEQMNKTSKLVPYDSESSSDERSERNSEDKKKRDLMETVQMLKPSRCKSPPGLIITTKAMHSTWTVSQEKNGSLMSPSLNGDTNKKHKEERRTENRESPNTSVSSMSPLSDRSETGAAVPTSSAAPLETVRHLNAVSHRGYGAPVASWTGTHSCLSRQVFEERREERKRAHEATDDMDRGRTKKIKKFHHYNRFNNNRNGYNPFQEKQNKQHWGHSFKYRGERRPHHHFNKQNNKYKRFNRYSNGHHYPRHH